MTKRSAVWRLAFVLVAVVAVTGMGSASSHIIDDFEDGDVDEWTSSSNWGITTNSHEGSYSGLLSASSTDSVSLSISSRDKTLNFSMSTDDTSNGYQQLRIINPDRVFVVEYRGGDLGVYEHDDGFTPFFSAQANTVYNINIRWDWGSNKADVYVDGTHEGLFDFRLNNDYSSYDEINVRHYSPNSATKYKVDNFRNPKTNTAPKFNSTGVNPDPPLYDTSLNYSAEVFDSDGSIDYTNLTITQDGTTVVSDAQRSNTDTPEWNDIYTPVQPNTAPAQEWLNATFTTVDDDGATNTTTLSRLLTVEPPTVNVTSPDNTTYFDYDVTISADVDTTGDSVPDENATCDIYNDNVLIDSQTKQGAFSVSTTDRQDFGTGINASVECADGSTANPTLDSVFYTIKLFEVDSTASDTPVYETKSEDYTTTLTLGDMVNSVNNSLQWQGEYRANTYDGSPTQGSNSYTLTHDVPLVTNNDTAVDWYNRFDINYTTLGGSTTTQTNETSNVTQSVYHSYSFDQAFLNPTNYTENQTYTFLMDIDNTSNKADLLGTDTYHRFNNQDVMDIIDTTGGTVRFEGNQDVGDADTFNNKDFNVSGEVKVSFQDRSRFIQSNNETVSVYKVQLTDCSTGDQALRFNSYREENISEAVYSDLDFSINVINSAGVTRVYNFTSEDKKQHTFCILPSNAEYTINNLGGKQIIYDEGNSTTESYAARNYWIVDETIDNTTLTTIPLYLIEDTDSDPITFEVRDSSNEPYPGVYGRVNRYYPGLEKEAAVAMFKTGSEGTDRIPIATTSEDHYRFQIFEETSLIWETTRQSLVESPKVITVEDESTPTYYDLYGQYGSSCVVGTTYVNCSYVSESESLNNATLTVRRQDFTGSTVVCEKSGQTLTGQLTCTGLNATEQQYTYELNIFDDGNTFIINDGRFGTVQDDFGLTGLLAALVLILSMAFAGLYDPRAMVGLTMIGVVAAAMTNLLAITTATTISFVAVGLVVLWRIR